MIELSDGWLFVGLDGLLYLVAYDAGDWHLGMGDYPDANGWTVEHVHTEHWGTVWPDFVW